MTTEATTVAQALDGYRGIYIPAENFPTPDDVEVEDAADRVSERLGVTITQREVATGIGLWLHVDMLHSVLGRELNADQLIEEWIDAWDGIA